MHKTPENQVRVRIAPSPTGPFHVGTARTALFNWLFARKHKGVFVVRIEDTDTERSFHEFENNILEGLEWLGISGDEGIYKEHAGDTEHIKEKGEYGPYRQSERTALYTQYLKKLLDEKKAYYCYCRKEELEAEHQAMLAQGLPPKYSGHCRDLASPPNGKEARVIRFKMPSSLVVFKDMIRGKVQFDAGLFGDVVIAKSLEAPLYNFAVVVDDYEMRITHVIRGEEHLPNTPKQILFQRALTFSEPIYAHVPLLLRTDRKKLSKRDLETPLLSYRAQGYIPEAFLNFLALLGWHPEDEKEIFTISELIETFDMRRVQKGGAIFDQEKLRWTNTQHLRLFSDEELAERIRTFIKEYMSSENTLAQIIINSDAEFLKKIIHIERMRLTSFADFIELANFFFMMPQYDHELLRWQKDTREKTIDILSSAHDLLESLPPYEFTRQRLMETLTDLTNKEGKGSVLWPLRVTVSGRSASPDPYDIMDILGRDETMRRIKDALLKLNT